MIFAILRYNQIRKYMQEILEIVLDQIENSPKNDQKLYVAIAQKIPHGAKNVISFLAPYSAKT